MPAGDMDSEYSVGVNNRFIGIDSDMIDDPLELIREAQQKPKKEKDTKQKGGKKDAKAPIKNTKEKTVKIVETSLSPTETKPSESSDRPRGERGRGRGRGGRGGERGRGRGRGGGFGGGDRNNQSDENSEQQSRPRGPPRGACHRCGEEGHFIRECPQPKSPATPKDNDGGFGSGGGFGAPSGGFGAPSGGFGAPSEGFGSPSSGGGGFGAPSGGFGGGFGETDERRGGRGGFRGGRGGRGGRGRGRGGGREFDRRSGSDKSSVKAFDKRDGSGSYNWGTPQDELAASEEQNQGGFGAPKDVDETPTEDAAEQTGEGSGAEETENKENAEPAQMSFEDYKKQLEENRAKPTYNIRQANEGEKMKGLKQLKKPTEEENEADGSLFFPRKIYEEKYKTSGRQKESLNFDYQFTGGENRHMDQSRRGGRGRGPRGGRGGNRRDEPFGGSGEKEIQLENNEEFPSL